jgi:hypothetical protein
MAAGVPPMPLRMRSIEDSKQQNPTGSAVTGWGARLFEKKQEPPGDIKSVQEAFDPLMRS